MKMLPKVILASALLMLSQFSFAANESSPNVSATKLAVVNVNFVLQNMPQAIDASKLFEQEFIPQQESLKNMAMDLESKQQDLQKNQLVMTDAQKQAAQRDITNMSRDLQRKQNDMQEQINIRRNESMMSLQKLVNEAINQIGKEQKLDLVLYDGIAYTNPKLDITKQVLAYLEAAYKSKRENFNK